MTRQYRTEWRPYPEPWRQERKRILQAAMSAGKTEAAVHEFVARHIDWGPEEVVNEGLQILVLIGACIVGFGLLMGWVL